MTKRPISQSKRPASTTEALGYSALAQRKCVCGETAGLDGRCAQCRSQDLAGPCRLSIRPKLRIGPPDDAYEREADRVADVVLLMPDQRAQRQTKPEEEGNVQAKLASNNLPAVAPKVAEQIQSMRGGGQPLPERTRAFFESRFGYDLSNIRTHNDERAATTADALNAHAYTVGQDIVFGHGVYTPQKRESQRLLAHELVHSLQQAQSTPMRVQRRMRSRRKIWSQVRKTRGRSHGNFPFRIDVRGIPCSCDDLKFEQFGYGGFTLYGPKKTGNGRESRRYDIFSKRRKPLLGPPLKRYGLYVQDILPGMSRGPNPVKNSPADVTCTRGRYVFKDAPGFNRRFGSIINDLFFDGIGWGAKFQHKLWCAGETKPLMVKSFRLVGRYFRRQKDKRRLFSD